MSESKSRPWLLPAQVYMRGALDVLGQLLFPLDVAPLEQVTQAASSGEPGGETMRQKVAVVTGGTSGVGLALVARLSASGWRVFVGDHHVDSDVTAAQGAREELAKQNEVLTSACTCEEVVGVTRVPLDLTSFSSVFTFAAAVMANVEQVDCLVLNAGVMLAPFHLCDVAEQHVQVNLLSHFYLQRILAPLLRRASNGTVVFVSSSVSWCAGELDLEYLMSQCTHTTSHGATGSMTHTNDPSWIETQFDPYYSYAQTKLALGCLAQVLHSRDHRKVDGIKYMAVHPGVVNTALYQHTNGFLQWMQRWMGKLVMRSPEHAALCIHALIANPSIAASGEYYCNAEVSPFPDTGVDKDVLLEWLEAMIPG
eukprot:m.53441 g.53441  ORF g.53441 m.53441 type:complete len:367 (+) comp11366_c0_seq1:186-1286(+)